VSEGADDPDLEAAALAAYERLIERSAGAVAAALADEEDPPKPDVGTEPWL
jgi:hypothetical protein